MQDKSLKKLENILCTLHTRRQFLGLFGKGLGYTALASTLPGCGGGGSGGGSPAPELPQASREYITLKRTSFGVHRDSLAEISSMGIDAFLDQQLDYAQIDDGNLESTIQALFPLSQQNPHTLLPGFPDNTSTIGREMAAATQFRQIFSYRQLYEIMVEFWSDHFNIHLYNGLGPTLKPTDDRQVIRQHALGNFRDLLHASASSPAMLFYLDNFLNQASAPNENYARELMELHTLSVDGGYSETDVKEVARCFTGWSIRFPGDPDGDFGEFVFIPAIHDNGEKTVLGNIIPAGGGQNDALQVLDILATHPSTASFIASKLCRRFINDNPDQASINLVATAFSDSNGDIKTTLRALFDTDAFKTTADLKFCRPSEYLAGSIRAIAPDTDHPTDNGLLFATALYIMGQTPFNWPTPDGYPDEQSYWLNTGGLLNRWRLSFISYAHVIPEINVFQIDYAALLNGAETISSIIDTLVENILMRPISSADRNDLVIWLTTETGQSADSVLSTALVEQLAPLLTSVLLSSAYFQLR